MRVRVSPAALLLTTSLSHCYATAVDLFSIKESIQFGWKTTKKHLWFLVGIVVILFFINTLPQLTNSQLQTQDASFLLALTGIGFWILNMLVNIGSIKISLKLADHKQAEFSDLFNEYRLLLPFIVGSIIYALIVVVGLIFLIVPGIYFGIRYHFYSYFIVDKKLSPLEALKESSRITSGVKWKLFLFSLVLGLVNVLGVLAFVVGLFVTVPVTMIAYAHVYRKLLHAHTKDKN